MRRLRVVGAVIAGLLACSFALSILGFLLVLALAWFPALAPILYFPTENSPLVFYFIMQLPAIALGCFVATKICGRAKEFIITAAVLTAIGAINVAETTGLTLSASAPYVTQIVCEGICLFLDQRGPKRLPE